MKITVTQEDIAQGRRCDPNHCPVGRAVSRIGVRHYCVTETAVIIKGDCPSATALLLPDMVRNWIVNFDEQKPVEPISFELGLPVPVACGCTERAPAQRPHNPGHRCQAALAAARCCRARVNGHRSLSLSE